jgi:tetratricopeptide (TPR) repeat protein
MLTSIIKEKAPRQTSLPLHQVMISALMDMLHSADTPQADPRQTLAQFSAELEQWQKLLGDLQDAVNWWYIFQSREWTFSPGWWQERFSELHSAFQSDPQDATRQWVQIFTQALVEWDLEGCQTLVQQSFPLPDYLAYLPLMFESGVEALIQGNLAEAEDMLTFLVQPGGIYPNQPTLEPLLHALVLVLMGRMIAQQQTEETQEDRTLILFNQARELAPQDGRPLAALGEYYRGNGEFETTQASEEESQPVTVPTEPRRSKADLDQATTMFKEAMRLSPDQSEGYTGMAMLMEDQGYWEEAHAWYRQAVECALRFPDPYRTLKRLLAPVSGNLYFHLAQALQDISARWALPAVETALELGMRGSVQYPEVEAYTLQGRLLRKLRKKSEAAIAYFEAGRRSGWNLDYTQAVEHLRQARKLDPTYQPVCWYLADDLRLLSVSTQNQRKKDALVRESLKVWEEGAALGEIIQDDSWALFTRALINELHPLRRSSPPEEGILFDWEAVFFTERNLLFSDDQAYQWTYLARFYRSLNLNANNLYVIDHAFKLDPNEISIREEKIIRTTNRGDFQAAEELLKPLLEDESYTDINWARSIYGYILSRLGKYEEALKSSKYNLDEGWVKFYRILCFMKLRQYSAAKEICEEIWQNREKDDRDSLASYSIAGLHLALLDAGYQNILDKAIEYARSTQNNPSDPFVPCTYLGYALLAKGEDLREARQVLEESISKATNKRELNDSINDDIPIFQELMRSLPHGSQAVEILEDICHKMQAQVKVIEKSTPTPEEELSQQLELLDSSNHPGMPAELVTNARLGVLASLARLNLNASRWIEAAQLYQTLLARADLIPEARLGLQKSLQGMQQSAETHLKQGDYQLAVPLMKLQADFAQSLGNEQELPDIHCQLSYAYLALAETQPESSLPKAADHLRQAAQHLSAQDRADAWTAVSECLRKSLKDVADYWRIDQSLGLLLIETSPEDAQLQAGLQELRQSLDEYLGDIYQLGNPYEGYPLVNRLAIELGSDLLPPGSSREWDLMRWISLTRWYFINEFGLEIPGVHIRLESETLAPDEYRILLDGQQVTRHHRIDQASGELVISSALQVAVEYNLERFMGIQAASQLLQEWQRINPTNFLAASRLLQDSASLLVFQQVMQELVGERIPANKPDIILPAMMEIPLANLPLPEIVARLRMALQPHLPGNTRQARRLALPAEMESELISYLQSQDRQDYLVLPNLERDRFIAGMRSLLEPLAEPGTSAGEDSSLPAPPVLVCQDARLRPLLRRMIAADLPDVPVLSVQEVLTEFPPEEEPDTQDQPSQAAGFEELEGDLPAP